MLTRTIALTTMLMVVSSLPTVAHDAWRGGPGFRPQQNWRPEPRMYHGNGINPGVGVGVGVGLGILLDQALQPQQCMYTSYDGYGNVIQQYVAPC